MSREKDAQLRQQQKQIAALARSSGEKDEQIRKLMQQVQELQKVQQRMASLEARLARHQAGDGNAQAATATDPSTNKKPRVRSTVAKVQF